MRYERGVKLNFRSRQISLHDHKMRLSNAIPPLSTFSNTIFGLISIKVRSDMDSDESYHMDIRAYKNYSRHVTAQRFESIVRLLLWHEHSHWKITCIVYVHIWKILSHSGTLYKYIHVYIRFQRNPHLTTWTWTAPAGNNHAWFNLLYVTSFKMKYLFSKMFWFLDLYPNPQQYSSSQTCETEFFKFCAK